MEDKNAKNHLTVRKKRAKAFKKYYQQTVFTNHIFDIYV